MRESYDEIYNGPTQRKHVAAGHLPVVKTGRFMAKSPFEAKGRTHDHVWIYGSENAVCTKCGYTLPKKSNLPINGLQLTK